MGWGRPPTSWRNAIGRSAGTGVGGGASCASGGIVCRAAFTQAHVTNNQASTGDGDIFLWGQAAKLLAGLLDLESCRIADHLPRTLASSRATRKAAALRVSVPSTCARKPKGPARGDRHTSARMAMPPICSGLGGPGGYPPGLPPTRT